MDDDLVHVLGEQHLDVDCSAEPAGFGVERQLGVVRRRADVGRESKRPVLGALAHRGFLT
jgi:hypothetical protein